MKRPQLIALAVVIAVVGALIASIVMDPPRRPRPEGWRTEWDALPLLEEGDWAMDSLKRGVVQAEFFSSTDELAHCVRKHGGEGATVMLELLVETEHGGTHFEYVEAEPRTDLPDGLVSCVTRALESAAPLPTPGLPDGTKWRLEVGFLVPPLAELPKVPWWQRFIPERWRPGRPAPHVG